jgi:hypothetical protein
VETTPRKALAPSLRIAHSGPDTSAQLFAEWFDPTESGMRDRVRHFIESMIDAELEEALSRPHDIVSRIPLHT